MATTPTTQKKDLQRLQRIYNENTTIFIIIKNIIN